MKKWFYGIYGIQFVWHGAWSDPEIIWHGKSFNYYDLETPLWEVYREERHERGLEVYDSDFEIWVKKNAALVREYLQNLMDYKCFYGGGAV